MLENGTQEEGPAGQERERRRVAAGVAAGYHKLEFSNRIIKLAVAPKRCLTLEDVGHGAKLWGLAVQLYGLRRPRRRRGIGDTSALTALERSAAARGADAIAISPTHALFAGRPDKFSPMRRRTGFC